MNLYKLFKIKDTNADMVSDAQFSALTVGTTIRRSTGEEYIKTDTNVFDKTAKTMRSDTENDTRYPQMDKSNIFNYHNIFNAGITVAGNIKSDNIQNTGDILTKNLIASENLKGNTLEVESDSNLADVYCSKLESSGNIKGNTLEISGASTLENIDASGYIKANGTIFSDTLMQAPKITITNEADINNIKSKTINNSSSIKTDSLEVSNGSIFNNITLNNAEVSTNLTVGDTVNTQNVTSVNITNSSRVRSQTFDGVNETLSGNLSVNGTSTLQSVSSTSIENSGNLSVNGISTFNGDISSRNITNSVNVQTSTLEVINNEKVLTVTPFTDNTGTVGTQALRFKTGYIETIYGTIFSGKAYKAGYADIAEIYTTDKNYEPGTVLQVCTSSNVQGEEYFNGTLLGVVSTNPGIVLNEGAEGCAIALKGMIPVKCENDIQKGQYCIARNGKVYGMYKHELTFENYLRIVGVALEDSKDGMVLVKV